MSGTVEGGKKASRTNRLLHGEDFYSRIGSMGGKWEGLKGFALNPELAKSAGRKGGIKSKRGPAKPKDYNITHTSPRYKNRKPNGALLYSREIVKYFIPNVKTKRHWVTVNTGQGYDNSIVFVHDNVNTEKYAFHKKFKNVLLVCSQKNTMEKVKDYGTPVYLPLSVDVEYVKTFIKDEKTKGKCYAGRKGKIQSGNVMGVPRLEDLSYDTLLNEMADYKKVYAVGRTAIEARILGCEILPYDKRYPDTSVWKVIDSREGGKMLQEILNKVDGNVA